MPNTRGFDVNRLLPAEDNDDAAAAAVGSTNSTDTSLQVDFSICSVGKREGEAAAANKAEAERASSRARDEEENGLTRNPKNSRLFLKRASKNTILPIQN